MKKFYITFFATSAIVLSCVYASASTISTSILTGSQWTVDNVAEWATTGNTMDNISITVTGVQNGVSFTETVSWADNIGANGSGWSLTMNDYNENTWNAEALWNLAADDGYTINSLVIDGQPGNTVFDIYFYPDTTPGSESGQAIWDPTNSDLDLNVFATYSNIVMVAGSTGPLGDLYQTLGLDFGTGFIGGGDQNFQFSLDTDNVNAPVPEPATMLMFGMGIAGLVGTGLRKRKRD